MHNAIEVAIVTNAVTTAVVAVVAIYTSILLLFGAFRALTLRQDLLRHEEASAIRGRDLVNTVKGEKSEIKIK